MKRTVIIVRHGKACAHDIFEKDIDRVLIKRGVKDGYKVSRKVLKSGIKPDLILTSPAARASHSAFIFARAMKTGTGSIKVVENFYPGSALHIIDKLSDLPDDVKTVAVFAHNPGVTDLAGQLTRGGIGFLPTTGTAIVHYDLEKWKDLPAAEPLDYKYIIPREL